MNTKQKIEKNIKNLVTQNINILGVAQEGISLEITIPASIDIFDFMDELGKYFYKIDDPIFGQRFVSNETKDYVYHWLMELFNTANYEELKNKTILTFNMEIDFDKVGTFKFACDKYEKKLQKDKNNKCKEYILFAEQIAIEILTMIDKIKKL